MNSEQDYDQIEYESLHESNGAEISHEETELDQEDGEENVSNLNTRYQLYCFNCNRDERHTHRLRRKWYFPYLVGFSFGLIKILGPFQCVCCGARRFTQLSMLHPRNISRFVTGKQSSSK